MRSTDGEATWSAVKLPAKKTRNSNVYFVNANVGFVIDASSQHLFRTGNGGRRRSQVVSTGSNSMDVVSFDSSTTGLLMVGAFGGDSAHGYLLRTDDARSSCAAARAERAADRSRLAAGGRRTRSSNGGIYAAGGTGDAGARERRVQRHIQRSEYVAERA